TLEQDFEPRDTHHAGIFAVSQVATQACELCIKIAKHAAHLQIDALCRVRPLYRIHAYQRLAFERSVGMRNVAHQPALEGNIEGLVECQAACVDIELDQPAY